MMNDSDFLIKSCDLKHPSLSDNNTGFTQILVVYVEMASLFSYNLNFSYSHTDPKDKTNFIKLQNKNHTNRKLHGHTVNRAVEYGSIVPLVVIKTTFYKE